MVVSRSENIQVTKNTLGIAISVSKETEAFQSVATGLLEKAGYSVYVFPADGVGGREMERLILNNEIDGVLDAATSELLNERVKGTTGAGPDRLTAAAIKGIPQVISLGGLDVVYTAEGTKRRSTAAELDATAKEIIEKASASRGPTRIIVPLKGLSSLDAPGKPHYDPLANDALFASLRNWVYPPELLVEREEHIDDASFATAAVELLLALMKKTA